MIRPAAFGFNEQTATNNFFQTNAATEQSVLQQKALAEFDGMVQLLSAHGIEVLVIEDTLDPVKPDAVFPNNWFCTFPSGVMAVFPMYAPNRRAEKRDDVLQWLTRHFDVASAQDWSEYEAEGHFLEGTGSMVIDHDNRVIYACISARTSLSLLEKFAAAHGYHAIPFHATDLTGRPVYHTNVVMCLGHGFAVVCKDAIADEMERIAVTQVLESTSHTLVYITTEQMHAFAGNMLQLQNKDGDLFLVMSRSAWNVLDAAQKKQLSSYATPLVIDVPTIEAVEGGSVRCMIAEIFLLRS
jgi:hypothetical protein